MKHLALKRENLLAIIAGLTVGLITLGGKEKLPPDLESLSAQALGTQNKAILLQTAQTLEQRGFPKSASKLREAASKIPG